MHVPQAGALAGASLAMLVPVPAHGAHQMTWHDAHGILTTRGQRHLSVITQLHAILHWPNQWPSNELQHISAEGYSTRSGPVGTRLWTLEVSTVPTWTCACQTAVQCWQAVWCVLLLPAWRQAAARLRPQLPHVCCWRPAAAQPSHVQTVARQRPQPRLPLQPCGLRRAPQLAWPLWQRQRCAWQLHCWSGQCQRPCLLPQQLPQVLQVWLLPWQQAAASHAPSAATPLQSGVHSPASPATCTQAALGEPGIGHSR